MTCRDTLGPSCHAGQPVLQWHPWLVGVVSLAQGRQDQGLPQPQSWVPGAVALHLGNCLLLLVMPLLAGEPALGQGSVLAEDHTAVPPPPSTGLLTSGMAAVCAILLTTGLLGPAPPEHTASPVGCTHRYRAVGSLA